MEETDDLKQRVIELESRVAYIEKKFNVNINSPEIMFPTKPTVVKAVIAEQISTNGDE